LAPDLQAAEEAKGAVQRAIDTWEGLVANVCGVQERGQGELRTMVDLGAQVYCQAEVPDTSHIFVNVGLGFHAELTLDEALAFAEKKLVGLRGDLRERVEEAASIQSHVKLVTEGIRELMLLSPESNR